MRKDRALKRPSRTLLWKIAAYAILSAISLLCVMPFYMMIINATRTNADILTSLTFIPGAEFPKNYVKIMNMVNIFSGFKNSFIVAISSTLLSVYMGSLTAYGFSKYKFKGNAVLFWILLCTMMLPYQISIIGYFKLMKFVGQIDRLTSLIIPGLYNAGMIFWVKQYCDASVPDELIESARIDGCGELKTFHRIIFPILVPAVACLSIMVFIASWNDFLKPIVLLFTPEKFTLPMLTVPLISFYKRDFAASYAGMAISVIPIVAVYAIMSKYVINGLTMGAVKQ